MLVLLRLHDLKDLKLHDVLIYRMVIVYVQRPTPQKLIRPHAVLSANLSPQNSADLPKNLHDNLGRVD